METRYHGIDWLRAFFSLCVVAWHLGVFGHSSLWNDGWKEHSVGLSDINNFNVLLLAVPVFFLISNFLLARSMAEGRFFNQIARVLLLLIFWPAAWHIYFGGQSGVLNALPSSARSAFTFFITGGHTIFYFFLLCLSHMLLLLQSGACPSH